MIINDCDTFDSEKIAYCFNKFFIGIGPKLASLIIGSQTNFNQYLNLHQTFLGEANLDDDELKWALKILKSNKIPGYHSTSSNVVKETSDIFFTSLVYIFSFLSQQGVFPENLQIARVSPIYKKDDNFLLTNYRSISVLSRFSNLLQCIMYIRLFKYLSENSILYEKQFGFQTDHSTEDTILQLVNHI